MAAVVPLFVCWWAAPAGALPPPAPTCDQLEAVEAQLIPALQGIPEIVETTLQCPTPPEEGLPPEEEPEDSPAVAEDLAVPLQPELLALPAFSPAPITEPAPVTLPASTPVPAVTARPALDLPSGGFSYPVVFLLPLALLTLFGYLTRALTTPAA